jgi:DNA-binding response OmpR family regulator
MDFGYLVLAAATGDEALDIARRHAAPIHLLLADIVLPGMSGTGLAERLKTGTPDLRVLFMSGYIDDTIIRNGVLDIDVDLISKPFTPQRLALRVREVLDGRRGRDAAVSISC